MFDRAGDPTVDGRTLICNCIPAERQHLFMDAREIVNFDVRPLDYIDLVMDMQDMSRLERGSFDTFIALHCLNHVADDERALAEIARVIRPGGKIILTVWYRRGQPTLPAEDITDTYGREALDRYGVGTYRCYGVDDFRALLAKHFAVVEYAFRDPLVEREEIVFVGTTQPPRG